MRRRMIEDMTIRKLAPKTNRLHPHHQGPRCVPRAIARHGELRGRPTLSTASGGERRACTDSHHAVAGVAFFFRVTLRRSDIIEHTTLFHEPASCRRWLSLEEWRGSRCRAGAQVQRRH